MRDLVDILRSTAALALQGTLLRDRRDTVVRATCASLVGAAIGSGIVAAGGPLWLATLAGGGIAGGLTPYILRNIKLG